MEEGGGKNCVSFSSPLSSGVITSLKSAARFSCYPSDEISYLKEFPVEQRKGLTGKQPDGGWILGSVP